MSMQKTIDKVEQMLMPLANVVSSNRYLLCMRDSFSTLVTFIIVGSLFGILNWVVFEPFGTILGDGGLNLGKFFSGGLAGDAYAASAFVDVCRKIQGLCGAVVNVTFGIFSLLLSFVFGYRLAKMWKSTEPLLPAAVSLASYLLVTPHSIKTFVQNPSGAFESASVAGFPMSYFGSSAVLTSIIVTTFVTWMFVKLTKTPKLTIKLPDSVPGAVSKSFAVVIPAIITLFVVTFIQSFLTWIGKPAINDVLYGILQAPLMNFSQGLGFALAYQFLAWFFWWFGIHGHNVTAVIQNMVYLPAQLANQTGEAAYIFTNGFFEATLGYMIALPIAIFIVSKRDDWKAVSKLGMPAMLFNIQEPLAFGIPIVLNPLLLIPYVISPLLNTVIGFLLISGGIMPVFKYVVPWTMPQFFGGIIGTGSIMGGLYQLLCVAIDVLIFIPFVKAANATAEKEKEALEKTL
ncbi:MAG: PTS transporter subunit EIIC [Spirochaetaceae bacterium]|jgi:PTS system cellobiose-specific IIC component|nr:PTS transporter subunit EIIC [Spirochaetaceae bacterium]